MRPVDCQGELQTYLASVMNGVTPTLEIVLTGLVNRASTTWPTTLTQLSGFSLYSDNCSLTVQSRQSMKGSIPKLAVHAVGARVLELLFGTFPNKVTVSLRQELYGPHFSLFASSDMATSVDNTKGKKNEKKTTTTKKNANDAPVGTLRSNLAAHPNKTDVTIEFVGNILQKGAEKSLFGFRYYQELFAEYIDVAPSSVLRKGGLISNVVDHSVHLLSTRAGTKVVAACVAYGTPKDRKKVLKSLKGYTRSSLLHRDAYLAVLRILQVTDDTVSLHKSVLAELLKDTAANDSSNNNNGDDDNDDEDQESSPMLELALHENASKLFLTLLVADCDAQKYLDPYEREILKANPTYVEGNEEIPTSKKNPETRRKELVLYLKQPLIRLCTDHTEELLRSLPGARVLKEVYSNYATAELVDALVQVCLDAVTTKHEGDNEEQPTMLFEDQIAHFSIKNIFQCDTSTANAGSKDKNKQQRFATAFLKELEPHLGKVGSSNRGAFVLTALCKAEPAAVKAVSKYKKAIIAHKKKAKKSTAGYEALLKELSGKKVSTARH